MYSGAGGDYIAGGPCASVDINCSSDCFAIAVKDAVKVVRAFSDHVDERSGLPEVQFEELKSLRGSKRARAFWAATDLACSPHDSSLVVTGVATGRLLAWDMEAWSRKLEARALPGHSRAVTRVTFHQTYETQLLSSSLDGTVRLWDLRSSAKEALSWSLGGFRVVRDEMGTKTSTPSDTPQAPPGHLAAVRDVQWDRSSGGESRFAAGLDDGSVQVWDVRSTRRPLGWFHAHTDMVVALAWHPRWPGVLASGGRDRAVRVWDVNSAAPSLRSGRLREPGLEPPRGLGDPADGSAMPPLPQRHAPDEACVAAVLAPAPVGRLWWRDGADPHVTTSPALLDSRVSTWDLRYPNLPVSSFSDARNIVADFIWLSSGRLDRLLGRGGGEGTKAEHELGEWIMMVAEDGVARLRPAQAAERPHERLNTVAVDLSGADVAIVTARGNRSTVWDGMASIESPNPADIPSSKRQGSAAPGLVTARRLYQTSRRPRPVSVLRSVLPLTSARAAVSSTVFSQLAKTFLLEPPPGDAPSRARLALHNAAQAAAVGARGAQQAWTALAAVYAELEMLDQRAILPPPPIDSPPETSPPQAVPPTPSPAALDPDRLVENKDEVEHLDDLEAEEDEDDDDDEEDDNEDDVPLTLTLEALLQRLDDGGRSISADPPSELAPPLEATPSSDLETSPAADPVHTHSQPPLVSDEAATQTQIEPVSEEAERGRSRVSLRAEKAWVEETRRRLVRHIVDFFASRGDVQMCVSVARVDGTEATELIGRRQLARFTEVYIELLHRARLWTPASTIMARACDERIRQVNQTSTTVSIACTRCTKAIPMADQPPPLPPPGGIEPSWHGDGFTSVPHTTCEKCHAERGKCALCRLPVRGIAVWCQGCGHGGHLEHMRQWFATHLHCPSGCGHACNLAGTTAHGNLAPPIRTARLSPRMPALSATSPQATPLHSHAPLFPPPLELNPDQETTQDLLSLVAP